MLLAHKFSNSGKPILHNLSHCVSPLLHELVSLSLTAAFMALALPPWVVGSGACLDPENS